VFPNPNPEQLTSSSYFGRNWHCFVKESYLECTRNYTRICFLTTCSRKPCQCHSNLFSSNWISDLQHMSYQQGRSCKRHGFQKTNGVMPSEASQKTPSCRKKQNNCLWLHANTTRAVYLPVHRLLQPSLRTVLGLYVLAYSHCRLGRAIVTIVFVAWCGMWARIFERDFLPGSHRLGRRPRFLQSAHLRSCLVLVVALSEWHRLRQ